MAVCSATRRRVRSRHVGRVQAEVVDERRDVIGHQPDVERAVDVSGTAVTLRLKTVSQPRIHRSGG
jgi:hypothetical protein